MRSIVCSRFGSIDELTYEEVPSPLLAANQVRVQLHYAAVNLSDELMVRGEYQLKPKLPFSPGSNGAGIVTEVGAAVERVKVGDRVSAGHFFGTYSEELVTDEDKVTVVPTSVSLDQAAALRIGHGTALFALETRGRLLSGEVVVVTGAAGGVGLATVDVARLLGATVIACVGNKAKAELVRRHGAHYAIDYSEEDVKSRILEITGGGELTWCSTSSAARCSANS